GLELRAGAADARLGARYFRGRVHRELHRQVERKGAPLPRGALEPDGAAQEPGDLPTDGEAKPGAAVLPAGGAVSLLERLEDDLVLVAGDADARVVHRERDHGAGRIQQLLILIPPARDHPGLQRHAAALGELE